MTVSILERLKKQPPALPQRVLVAGASGGIGGAFCHVLAQQQPTLELIRLARNPHELAALPVPTQDIAFNLLDETSIIHAVQQLASNAPVDWVFIASGWLHNEQYQPEKTYRQLDSEPLMHAYQVNAIGPALLIKQLLQQLDPKHPCNIGVLSARVGSISDNRLGGWHAYRASKAALNMLIKNFAIELNRLRRPTTVVGLQPGTTDSKLSAPFQRNLSADQLQTPEFTAQHLMQVMQALKTEDSGELFDFLGLRFAP